METSQTIHFEAFIRPMMSKEKVISLVRTVWEAGIAHGTKMTNLAHEVLDREPLILSKGTGLPLPEFDLPTRVKIKCSDFADYIYHYHEARKIIAGINREAEAAKEAKKQGLYRNENLRG